MRQPSPKAHLYRLVGLLIAGLVGFVVVKAVATPASWDYEHWYRGDAVKDIAAEPLSYGGNESCVSCHREQHTELLEFNHKTLSCESCHGALADHVKDGKKIAAATVDNESNWQCLNCHEKLINRPAGFPQFAADDDNELHKEVANGALCVMCHNAHNPLP